jgi:hypothetical protein
MRLEFCEMVKKFLEKKYRYLQQEGYNEGMKDAHSSFKTKYHRGMVLVLLLTPRVLLGCERFKTNIN